MSFSWIKPYLEQIDYINNMINSYYNYTIITGSSSIVYMILCGPFNIFDPEIQDTLLRSLGYDELHGPKDIDFIVVSNTDIVISTFGQYYSTQNICSSKTYTRSDNNLSFDLIKKTVCSYIDINGKNIISPKHLLNSYLEDRNESNRNDQSKITFLQNYMDILNKYNIIKVNAKGLRKISTNEFTERLVERLVERLIKDSDNDLVKGSDNDLVKDSDNDLVKGSDNDLVKGSSKDLVKSLINKLTKGFAEKSAVELAEKSTKIFAKV
jgi:hypothetical protein